MDSAADTRDSAESNPAAPAAPVSASLSAIERVRLARHPARPQTLDYVERLMGDFFEIHGDRRFADDGAIVAGMGYFGRRPVAIVGHQRGRSTPNGSGAISASPIPRAIARRRGCTIWRAGFAFR